MKKYKVTFWYNDTTNSEIKNDEIEALQVMKVGWKMGDIYAILKHMAMKYVGVLTIVGTYHLTKSFPSLNFLNYE